MFQMIVEDIIARWVNLTRAPRFIFGSFFSLYREWCGGEGLMKSVIYKSKELNFKVIF